MLVQHDKCYVDSTKPVANILSNPLVEKKTFLQIVVENFRGELVKLLDWLDLPWDEVIIFITRNITVIFVEHHHHHHSVYCGRHRFDNINKILTIAQLPHGQ